MKPERAVYLLVEIALVAAIVLVIMSSIRYAQGADTQQTCAQRPLDRSSWWSYRLVNGRQCWYRGKQRVAREQLHWGHTVTPTDLSVAGQPDDRPSAVPVIAAVPVPDFDLTWRGLMDDLNAANMMLWWLNPTPITQWRLP